MYKRHGLKSMLKMCQCKSIGMINIAGIAKNTCKAFCWYVENATARGANLCV